MNDDVIIMLTAKDDRAACAYTERIIAESRLSDAWYEHFDDIASLLDHPKSLVRNRAMNILAENVRWDAEGRFDTYIEAFLEHITDEKPVTARQCIKFLPVIAEAEERYIPLMERKLRSADISKYKDSMRPLIEKDIADALVRIGKGAEG